jgi:hypothetical protein
MTDPWTTVGRLASEASTTMPFRGTCIYLSWRLWPVLSQGKRLPGVSQDADPSGGLVESQ